MNANAERLPLDTMLLRLKELREHHVLYEQCERLVCFKAEHAEFVKDIDAITDFISNAAPAEPAVEPPQRAELHDLPTAPGVWFRYDTVAIVFNGPPTSRLVAYRFCTTSGKQLNTGDQWDHMTGRYRAWEVDELPRGHWSQPDAELLAECERLRRAFEKLSTVGCSCGTGESDPGDCYGCRGHMLGILYAEAGEADARAEAAEATITALRSEIERLKGQLQRLLFAAENFHALVIGELPSVIRDDDHNWNGFCEAIESAKGASNGQG